MSYFGYYNELGYWICSLQDIGFVTEHIAGNHQFDGTAVVPTGCNACLSLEKIKQHCEKTGKEIAEENSGEWRGVQYDD